MATSWGGTSAGSMRFNKPKIHKPNQAAKTRQQQLAEELGLLEEHSDSDSRSESGDERGSDGELSALQEENARLVSEAASTKAQLISAQRNTSALEQRIRNMQVQVVANKKAAGARKQLMTKMLDSIYDLEQKLEEAGIENGESLTDHYDELIQAQGSGDTAALPAAARAVAPPAPPAPSGAGGGAGAGADGAAVAALQSKNEKLQREVEKAKSAAKALGKEVSAAKKQHHEQLDQLKHEVADLKQRLHKAQMRQGATEAGTGTSGGSSADAAALKRLEEANRALQQELSATKATAAARATSDAAKAGSGEEALRKQLAEAEQALGSARTELDSAMSTNDDNMRQAREALTKLREKYNGAKADKKTFKAKLIEASNEMRRLETLTKSQQEELAAAKASVVAAQQGGAASAAEALASARATAAAQAAALQKALDESQASLAASQRDTAQLQERVKELSEKHKSDHAKIKAAREALAKAQADSLTQQEELMHAVKGKYTKRVDKWKGRAQLGQTLSAHNGEFRSGLRKTLGELRRDVVTGFEDISGTLQKRCQELAHLGRHNSRAYTEVVRKYKRECQLRRKIFNDLQDLRGNIRVFARVRPVLPGEDGDAAEVAVEFPTEGVIRMTNTKNHVKKWEFDHVFKPKTTNAQVFDECSDLLTSVADGYNVCIFAYGQTGSGKTYTMEGPPSDRGLNFRTLTLLFNIIEERKAEWEFDLRISLLEIYNETIIDLLTNEQKGKLSVKMSEHGMVVPGLTMVAVHSSEEVLKIMSMGYDNRTTFATASNVESSRSHCALSVYVVARNRFSGVETRGKLHLVDLAGSERVAKSGVSGDRLREAQAINKSLSALGDVIAASANKKSHIPFRNSTLTYLLQDSLSKQSKTLMFVNLAPTLYNSSESFCSMDFAARVRTVELGKATKNVTSSSSSGKSRSRKK